MMSSKYPRNMESQEGIYFVGGKTAAKGRKEVEDQLIVTWSPSSTKK